MNHPSESAWLDACAEAADRIADLFDPIRHSRVLEAGRLDPETIDSAKTLAKRYLADFEKATEANPAFVEWKKEFEYATQHKYLIETLDAPGLKANTPLVFEGLRTGNIALLVQWSVENNPEARAALETSAQGERPDRTVGPVSGPGEPKDEPSDPNYRVPVDPRSLAPTATRGLESEEEHEPQRANVRRYSISRQIAVATDLAASEQTRNPVRPGGGLGPPSRGAVRSGLPAAPRPSTPGGGRGDLGR